MKTKSLLPLACLVALAVGAGSAMAVPVQYTSKTAWQAAVVTSMVAEDFESNVGAFTPISTPFTTANGLGLVTAGIPQITAMQILPAGTITTLTNGTQFLHFRDFGVGLKVNLAAPSFAFGFDYGTNDIGWNLSAAGGVNYTIPSGPGTAGFIGYIDLPANLFSSFTLKGPGPNVAQGGLSIDNVLVAASVPEPQSYALFAVGLASVALTRRRKKAAADGAWPEMATGCV